jgi:hypothetical protein
MKTSQADIIFGALIKCSKIENLDPSVNYCIARNINRLKNHMKQLGEDNIARVQSFAKKAPDGTVLTKGGDIIFGENLTVATEKYNELMNKEIDFEPYTIERSDLTDKLPANALSELLDIIIIEKQ